MNLAKKHALTVAWLAGAGTDASEIAVAMDSSVPGRTGTTGDKGPTDAEKPPAESPKDDGDSSVFMSLGFSGSLRLMARKRLFHRAAFRRKDGLARYANDSTSFAASVTRLGGLSEAITADTMH